MTTLDGEQRRAWFVTGRTNYCGRACAYDYPVGGRTERPWMYINCRFRLSATRLDPFEVGAHCTLHLVFHGFAERCLNGRDGELPEPDKHGCEFG